MPQHNDPVRQLLAHYTVQDVIFILKVLNPFLNEKGRTLLPAIESDPLYRECRSYPFTRSRGISNLHAHQGSSSRMSTSTWSSGRSIASSMFDRSPSGMGFSDASSIAESTVSENDAHHHAQMSLVSARKGGQRSAAVHRISKPTHKAIPPAAPSPLLAPRKPSFECPFCWELEIPSSISRKADLKRHFKQFHQNNAQWICPERSCGLAFDWRSAFEMHLKESHRNAQHASDTAMVKLCPQVVFACGFSNCRLIFEASGDEDAEKKAQEYFNHVANHFDDNLTHRNWSYSVRFRNLMRQTAVDTVWKERKKGPQDPKWQPRTSSVVRKLLETRHFSDIPLLVQWVVRLGSNPYCETHSPMPKLPADLRLPVKERCALAIEGHLPAIKPEPQPVLLPERPAPQPSGVVEHTEKFDQGEQFIKTDPDTMDYASPTATQHPDAMLPSFDLDSSYTPYSHDTPMRHSQLSPSGGAPAITSTTVTSNTAATDNLATVTHDDIPPMVSAEPLSLWLGLGIEDHGTPTHDMHLHQSMDAIIGYSHAQAHAPPDYRQMMVSSNAGSAMFGSPGMLGSPATGQQPLSTGHAPHAQHGGGHDGHGGHGGHGGHDHGGVVMPMDLEMQDCPYENDVNCF